MKAIGRSETAAAFELECRPVAQFHGDIAPAIEAAGIGAWQLDMQTGLATWDGVANRILGRGEWQSHIPAPLPIHPDDRADVQRRLVRNAQGGGERHVDVRIITPSGHTRWIRATARAPRDTERSGRWVTGIVTDIHEQKVAEASLIEAERQLTALISNLPGIAYRCLPAPPWSMSFVSEGVNSLTGYAVDEVTAAAFAWAKLIDPEDIAYVNETVAKALDAQEAFSLVYRIRCQSGETKWVTEKGRAVYDANGEPIFLEGFIGDITEQKIAEAKATEASRLLGARLDCVPQMLWSVAPDGRTDYYRNKQWYDFTGCVREAHRFSDWKEIIHPADRRRVESAWARSLKSGHTYEVEYRLRHHSGEFRWISSRGSPQFDQSGRIVHWYGTCTDIHDRVIAEQKANSIAELTHGVVEASPDCVSLLDLDGTVLHVNQAVLDCYGVEENDLLNRAWGSQLPSEYGPVLAKLLRRARSGKIGRTVISVCHASGRTRWWDMVVSPVRNANKRIVRIAVTSRDVSEQRRSEEMARWAAMHDPLTKLANRSHLTRELKRAIRCGKRAKTPFALVLVDVDHFKTVNDTLGHDAGDALLCWFADQLSGSVRPGDLVSRLGGDEFALLLRGVGVSDDLQPIVDRLMGALREPFLFKGRIMDPGASFGAALFPADGETGQVLLKNADVALYAAKAAGRGVCTVYAPEMRAQMQRRASMNSMAKQALAENWIRPHYQPKVLLASGKLAGFEALLRWLHPTKGMQMPQTVAAAFEDLDLAQQLTHRMLALVLQDMRKWEDAGIQYGHVAINAAAADFRRGDFAERLLNALLHAAIPTSRLQVEVTETVFLGRGAECVESALKLLSREGVKVALDDFGTGYASLSHLKQFPVDILKIDRSFVSDLNDYGEGSAIVRAVVNLGQGLDIAVVAEGVETPAQHKELLRLGCQQAQGHLYGRALPAADAAAFASRVRHF